MKKPLWTTEKIKQGFEDFMLKNGRLPRAHEIDTLENLPSSRLIQRKFGGLESLRKELGFEDSHFGKGKFRSIIANDVNGRGRKSELDLEDYLVEHFGEVFVHSEKMLEDSKVRVDFYVYNPDDNFAVDIFYADTMRTLQSNVNIKVKKYTRHTTKIYLVSANTSITQDNLDRYSSSKIIPLPSTVILISLENFIKYIEKVNSYPNPLP